VTERPFSYEQSDDAGRLTLHGDLDEGAVVEARELIRGASQGLTRDLTLDLTDLTLLPSSAVGVLATAQETARRQGATLSLVAAEGTIAQRVLTICGIEHQA